MRLIPILTATLVMFVLYVGVFQRDALMAFARGELTLAEAAADAKSGSAGEDPVRTAAVGSPTVTDASPTATDATPAATSPAEPSGQNAAGTPREGAVAVVALKSLAQTVDSAVILRGQTKAARQVEVRAEIAAPVISEPLRKGAFVKAGDVLCRLDPGSRAEDLVQAKAALTQAISQGPEALARIEEAKALAEQADIDLNAAEKLSQGGYASTSTLVARRATKRSAEARIAAAESGVDANKAAIEAAKATLAKAEREIERLEIEAPFDGLLETDAAELGSLLQPGSLCATVIQLDPIKLVGFVPETDIGRVEMGAPAQARLINGDVVTGRVSFIGRSADPTTRTFLTEITVPNKDLKIRDGQTADIAISAAGSHAHKLPQSALTLNNDGALGVRTAEADGLAGFHRVKLIRDEPDGVWVTGLPDEIDVIVVGQDFVTAGVPVTVTYDDQIHANHKGGDQSESKP
ncbi:efflux RND transporter periplasmic adaptor subunit [Chachezhania sediminis]|uniref:efflux RND transporter periplasmic adaptor subunit n=1 Tax=Chachezhania sediminis TaxID=2599291 RepID=UPI00131C7285|nr:efflux RND transporter periplasmic adaptor subunit [Chachezhania sediminis]